MFTGLRPGEKLHEELFYSSETLLPAPHEKVQRTHSQLAPWPNLSQHLQELRQVLLSGSEQSMRAKIQDIVPEYRYECLKESQVIADAIVPSIALPLSRSTAANG